VEGLNIFRKVKGIAIASAIRDALVRAEYFSIEFIVIASARVITKKNQALMTSFHLYFIRMKISAKARANENTIDMKVGVSSVSGVSSPYGRGFWFEVSFVVGEGV